MKLYIFQETGEFRRGKYEWYRTVYGDFISLYHDGLIKATLLQNR